MSPSLRRTAPRTSAAPVRAPGRGARWQALLAIVAVATVLRPSVVTVGPVLPDVRSDLGLSASAAALLTALPLLCFGLGAFAGPVVARRLGVDGGLTAALLVLSAGALVRVVGGPALLFAGTLVLGAAVAVGNVLLPVLVKRDFPSRVGAVTGIYTSTLSAAAGVAALVAVPVATATAWGWRSPLALWGLASVVALGLWLLGRVRRPEGQDPATGAAAAGAVPAPRARALLRSPVALALTAYMGLQSLAFYVLVGWLPTLLRESGVPATTAGALLSLATVLGIPAGLTLPVLATRLRHQSGLVVGATALNAIGWVGLLVAPAAAPLVWVVLLGLGTGATFPLALLLVVLRSGDPRVTPQLSAMVQGLGYLVAATGPVVVGVLHDVTGGWTVPLVLMLVLTALQAGVAWLAGREAVV